MDAAACGVFATVIPVLLLAGFFARHAVQRAINSGVVVFLVATVGIFVYLGEALALVGVTHGGLHHTGWIVQTAAFIALAGMVAATVFEVVILREEKVFEPIAQAIEDFTTSTQRALELIERAITLSADGEDDHEDVANGPEQDE